MNRIAAAFLAGTVLAVCFIGGQSSPSRTPVAHGATTNAVLITPTTCLAVLIGASDTAFAAGHCGIIGGATGFNIDEIALEIGDQDGVPEYEDFAGMSALESRQVQSPDGFAWIVAFVNDNAPVVFDGTPGGGTLTDTRVNGFAALGSQDLICEGPTSDQDCGGQAANTDNGAVTVGLCMGSYPSSLANSLGVPGCVGAPAATRGKYTLTVVQEQVPVDINYSVVGPPHSIEFQVFEDTVSTGIDIQKDPLTNALITPGCPLATDVAGFTQALGRPEKTVVIARVSDVDDNNITSAWVDWQTDDKFIGVFATNLTPTLNLGGFGFGAPNVFCGTRDPGVTEMTIRILTGPNSVAVWFPSATLDVAKLDETVLGQPAAIALTSTPAQIACDGKTSASVSALITTAAGENVVDGTGVNFSVQVLGTASPINTTTAGGIATTVVLPFAAQSKGVPVLVSAGVGDPVVYDVQSSILVACSGAPAPGAEASGQAPPPGTGAGTITPPDTGSGGEAGNGWARVNVFAIFGLAAGALALASVRLRVRG